MLHLVPRGVHPSRRDNPFERSSAGAHTVVRDGPSFRGDASHRNPERLYVLQAVTPPTACQTRSFGTVLAVTQRARGSSSVNPMQ